MTDEQIKLISEDPKAFLVQGLNINALVKAKKERIDSWRLLAESITVAFKGDGETTSSLYKQSTVANAACNIVDIESEITEEIKKLAAVEIDIHEAINKFVDDERYKAILELRYLNGYGMRRIGTKLYYTEDWVCKLHGWALKEMKENAKKFLALEKSAC